MRNHDFGPGSVRGERRFRLEGDDERGMRGHRGRRGHGPGWGGRGRGREDDGPDGAPFEGPPFGGPPFGPGFGGPPFGPGGPRGRGRGGRGRARGDVRAAILLLLDEQPRHGYELIQEIGERSQGTWTPSPGSVYPTLQALADEGLVTVEPVEGRRTASLTPDGVAYVAEHRERLGTPWTAGAGDTSVHALRTEVLAVKDAAMQVARVGTPAQQAAAVEALTSARKALYRLLAEDDAPEA
ncbi:PadR family transcriptional regulator [Cellulomonas sp. APG4]|uniref:PadR family transcriptional regulator n=1 Tax=Cellulomonas sp. APG4 TaxID=1538656 RepID=UPI001ED8C100|nr:PadR family transcriptional regulator [Cellulomonas sp. APG4]